MLDRMQFRMCGGPDGCHKATFTRPKPRRWSAWGGIGGLGAVVSLGFFGSNVAAQFVEPDATTIYTLVGENPGDRFGIELVAVADYDGDGAKEYLISASGNDDGGVEAGKTYLVDGRTGATIREHPGSRAAERRRNVSDAGDVNGDGIVDYLVGTSDGWVYVYSGLDGSTLHELTGSGGADQFGFRSCGVGDINSDSFGDLLVGAPQDNTSGFGAGKAYLISGIDGTVLRTHSVGSLPGNFGHTVSMLGDLDGDNVPDYYIGAPGPEIATVRGKAYIYSGATGVELSYSPLEPVVTGRIFGAWVNSFGSYDMTGDGVPDFTVTDLSDAVNGRSGRLYLFNGATGDVVWDVIGYSSGSGFGGITPNPPSALGDVTGDGIQDFLVGSWESDVAAHDAGEIDILNGVNGARLRTITSTIENANFGGAAAGLGMVDGDAFLDFAVGSNQEDGFRGVVYVFAGQDHTLTVTPATPLNEGVTANRYLGLVPGNPGVEAAVRVRLSNIDGSGAFADQTRWVGPPMTVEDPVGGTVNVAQLACTPYYTDWSSWADLFVFGADVVPNSSYDVQILPDGCLVGNEGCYSAALAVTTQSRWGDVIHPLGGPTQPNLADVSALVLSFQGAPGGPPLPQADLIGVGPAGSPNTPNQSANLADVSAAVTSFQGSPFPYSLSMCP